MAKEKDPLAPQATAATAPKFDPSAVKVVKAVTLPVFKQQDNVTLYVKILEPIFTGKEIKAKDGEKAMEPARIANVMNHETGEVGQLICNKVLESSLAEAYEKNTYVGKSFAITRLAGEKGSSGRKYKSYKVVEIEVG